MSPPDTHPTDPVGVGATSDATRSAPRLFLVSNRLASPGSTQTGGLAHALAHALAQRGGDWLGWSGGIGEGDAEREQVGTSTFHTLPLTLGEHRDYYLGYANRSLWPLLHSQLELFEFERAWRDAYLATNQRFADAVAARLHASPSGGTLVWIHDYHFLCLAPRLRARGIGAPLGFFLHTPFPAPDIVRTLPFHDEVFCGLLACDLIGVQTHRDAAHLRDYLGSIAGARRVPAVRVFPVGIDAGQVARDAARASVQGARARLEASLHGRALVIGVDRLDYSKGLPKRFTAYGRMLESEPDLRRQVSFLQIAPVSRGEVAHYRQLKQRLDGIAGAINARFGDADWVPLRYVARAHPHATLAAYFRSARVGLVTPLRDGMNLVAREFVAAQDGADPGVLVLSEFAGAAEALTDALCVNPYDTDGVAAAVARGLRMARDERIARWQALHRQVARQSVAAWSDGFLAALARRGSASPPRAPCDQEVFA